LTRSKLEWLAKEQRLFMPSAAHLGDPLEGIQPLGDKDWWIKLAVAAVSDDERSTIQHNHDLLSRFAAAFRTRYYVSCWHMNTDVNAEIWNSYAGHPESVVVQTTFAKLRAALPTYVGIGMVRYIDYAKERLPTLNMLEYITHKNQRFAHECELRAVAMHPVVGGLDQQHFRDHHFESENDPSFRVYAPTLSLSTVLESVVLHREAPEEFGNSVTALCEKAGVPIPTRSYV
jgi:hypothetical protein